jgi:hypothetical protein
MRRSALTGQEWMQRYVRSRLLSNPGRDAGPMSSSAQKTEIPTTGTPSKHQARAVPPCLDP